MSIKPPHSKDRKIVREDGKVLSYSEQMGLAEKVLDLLVKGEIEPIQGCKVAAGSIQGNKVSTGIIK